MLSQTLTSKLATAFLKATTTGAIFIASGRVPKMIRIFFITYRFKNSTQLNVHGFHSNKYGFTFTLYNLPYLFSFSAEK
jgi:hypothetical protein